jgi:hypothetical protein
MRISKVLGDLWFTLVKSTGGKFRWRGNVVLCVCLVGSYALHGLGGGACDVRTRNSGVVWDTTAPDLSSWPWSLCRHWWAEDPLAQRQCPLTDLPWVQPHGGYWMQPTEAVAASQTEDRKYNVPSVCWDLQVQRIWRLLYVPMGPLWA